MAKRWKSRTGSLVLRTVTAEPRLDALGLAGDRREHDLGGGDGEVFAVVLPDPDEVQSDPVGEDTLRHDVAQHLRVRDPVPVVVVGRVAERVQPEHQRKPARPAVSRAAVSRHAYRLLVNDMSTITRPPPPRFRWRPRWHEHGYMLIVLALGDAASPTEPTRRQSGNSVVVRMAGHLGCDGDRLRTSPASRR